MKKIKVGIVGITSVTGKELWNILTKHKNVVVTLFTSESQKGKKVSSLKIKSDKIVDGTFDEQTYSKCCFETELLFLCLSHNVSMRFVKEIITFAKDRNLSCPKIIDLSGDFRLQNIKMYEKYYKEKHIFPIEIKNFVYGLSEINKDKIKNANFVSNPGCYPTTVILGLAPIIKNVNIVIVDSKSGYSGGGKKLVEEYETAGSKNTYAYNVQGMHRHIPEIEEQLSILGQRKIKIIFTPHVVPQYRGMYTDIYVKTIKKYNIEQLISLYKKFYFNQPFIKILDNNNLPQTKNVEFTNFCEIGFGIQKNFSNWIKIFVAIDNLIKGAVGQAVQNMNLMFNFNEKEGLE
ncbi:MAG: N-acetyl-gamma-glutamyl-phosphate reductase [Endomicrobiia bacterium]